MSSRPVIGIMGPADATAAQSQLARELGRRCAEHGWIVLTGGRSVGVMDAALAGAKEVAGSLTVGVVPDEDRGGASPHADVVIVTGLGSARNNVNVLSSDVVVAIGVEGPGTASEVALALKAGKPVILLAASAEAAAFFQRIAENRVHPAPDIASAVPLILAAVRFKER